MRATNRQSLLLHLEALSFALSACSPALVTKGSDSHDTPPSTDSAASMNGAGALVGGGTVSDAGDGCEVCDGGCRNGLVTVCLALDPPGCGGQSLTQFCPYGCTPDGPEPCNFYPVDGAVSSRCIASSATIQPGTLQEQGATAPVAVTTFLPTEARVIIATTASAACTAAGEAGATTDAEIQAALTLLVPLNTAGTFPIGAGNCRPTWKFAADAS